VKIVCSAHEGNDLPSTSIFAETLDSFSTISQEKRHVGLPSWYVPQMKGELIVGCLKRKQFKGCG
jgi:hypothetical protein